jgi:hypothetical protein
MIEVVGFDGSSWRDLKRPLLTILFGAILGAILVTTVFTNWLREFFDFTSLSTIEWITVFLTVVGTLTLQYLVTKNWSRIIRFVTAEPKETDKIRGRIV